MAVIHYTQFQGSIRQVADVYGVGKSTLARWVKLPLKTPEKSCRPKARPRYHSGVPSAAKACLSECPFTTAEIIQRRVFTDTGTRPSRSTIYRVLHKVCGVTHKRSQRARLGVDPVPADHAFFQSDDPYDGAISVDESHFQASDSPRYGWSTPGVRVPVRKPNRYQRVSLPLAVDSSGVVDYELVTEKVKSLQFISFLKKLPADRAVILDNASIHRAKAVQRHCLESGTDLRFIPPYCPWYNPVEYHFSDIKARFRRLRVTGVDFLADIRSAISASRDDPGCFAHAKRIWSADREIT